MKKILLLLLLATFSIQAQTLQNPTYGNVKLKNNVTDNSATKVNVQSTDGTINTISKSDLVNVVEVNDVPSLPLVGEVGKIYVVKNVNKIYRWNGTFYQELAGSDITYQSVIDALGFVPENVANKAVDISTGANNTTYPSSLAVKTYADFKSSENILFENKQATRDFYKNIDNYSNSPTNTLIGVTSIGDSMSEGMPLAFTRTLSNFFPSAALVSGGFGLASALGFSSSGTLVYNGRAILTGVDFTYLPNGNHIEMTNGAVINEDTGQATTFSKLKVFFATGVGMGSVLVELVNNTTGVVLDSQTLDLSGVDTGAIKAEFSLVSTIKYKVRITATNKVVYLFSAFLKSNGVIPFSLGKGGSSFAENTSSNKAILSYIASEMHISMVMLMAKEPVPSPYISDMMSMLTTYFPNSSKIIFASLPDSRTPSVVIEENRVLKEAALGSGFAWFDTYKVNKDYAELVRLGQNGDGTHPTIQPYEYANQLLFTELGFDNAVGAVIKRSINHIGTSNNVSTNILRVANGDGSGTTVDAISNAGGATPNYILIKNVRSLALGPISGNTPGLAPFGSSVAVVTSANDALTTLRAKNLDIADATATSAINGNLTVGKLLKMTTTPTTSAAGYDILTRHTTTNAIEKVPSSTFATTSSPTFTGIPTAPTATVGTNTTQIATTAFVAGGLATKENAFTKNTAFNKNFGTTAGTVVEGGTLGSNAYSSTSYLPLSGGTLNGKTGIALSSSGLNLNNSSFFVNNTSNTKGGVFGYNDVDDSFYINIIEHGVAAKTLNVNASQVNFSSSVTAAPATLSNHVVVKSQLDAYLPLSGGTLTGIVTAPTAAPGTNTTQIATTAFVQENVIATQYWTKTANDIRNNNTGNVFFETTGNVGYYPASGNLIGQWLNGSFSSGSIGIRQSDAGTDGVAMYLNSEQAYIYGGTARNMNVGTLKTDGVINASIDNVVKTITSNSRFESLVPIKLKNYTVATLPTGTQGDTAYVTDALAPTYMATVVGGGAVVTPVFYNGTAWVSH